MHSNVFEILRSKKNVIEKFHKPIGMKQIFSLLSLQYQPRELTENFQHYQNLMKVLTFQVNVINKKN